MTAYFETRHPEIVVVGRERASILTMDANTAPHIGAMISISDPAPGEKRPPEAAMKRIPTLRLTFDDAETAVPILGRDEDATLCTLRDVEVAMSFAREHRGRRILIHCFAGRARSTAIALAILADRWWSGPNYGINHVKSAKQAMSELLTACERDPLPNMLIVRLADEALALNGALVRVALEQNTNPVAVDPTRPVIGTALLAAIKRGDL